VQVVHNGVTQKLCRGCYGLQELFIFGGFIEVFVKAAQGSHDIVIVQIRVTYA